MRLQVIAVSLLASIVGGVMCGGALWSQQPQQPQQPPRESVADESRPIRQNVNLVNVLFTVFDRQNRIVSNLERNNFQVFDNNSLQEIRFFSRQTDLPLRVGLLMDTSNSIRERLRFEQDAAVDFLFNVIRRDKDEAFLMSVDDQPEVEQAFTHDLQRLRDAIMRQRAGGGTALYDAVYRACEEVLKAPSSSDAAADIRRVLVVISDGDDNVSRHTRAEALEMAQRANIVLYTISTSTDWIVTDQETSPGKSFDRKYRKTGGDSVLQQFADDSGGRAFFPYRVDDLALSFSQIGDELRSQYSLAYVLPRESPDGKFHNIRVSVSAGDNKGMRVRARKGYYATAPSATTGSSPNPGF